MVRKSVLCADPEAKPSNNESFCRDSVTLTLPPWTCVFSFPRSFLHFDSNCKSARPYQHEALQS